MAESSTNIINSVGLNDAPLLCVQNIEISRQQAGKWCPIVQNVSLELHAGEMAALVGPSGCGKSMTAHALVGLLETGLCLTGGQIFTGAMIFPVMMSAACSSFAERKSPCSFSIR